MSTQPIRVEIDSGQAITLDKLIGPSFFANLRITAVEERGWVIEREGPETGQWTEWCLIPGRLEGEATTNPPPPK